jgi:RNA ligase
MNYEFPFITNISDVLPAIEGRDEFVVAEKEGYTVINYNVMMADTFPDIKTVIFDMETFDAHEDIIGVYRLTEDRHAAIRRECRGIIFDSVTGDIIRRPFHKFFNVNERDETQDHRVDLSRPHAILEKLDGSMIAPFLVNGEMIWGTKMGATDVAKPVEEFVRTHPQYVAFANWVIEYGFTPIFEWCSRKQRIVLDYKEDQLILTGARNMSTGEYRSFKWMVDVSEGYGIPCVRAWGNLQMDNKTMRSFMEYVHDLEDLEGFVVRFDDGHMLKLKCHWYLQIHKAKEAILQDRNIVELILDEKLDDVKAHLPAEDRDRLTQFEHDINIRIGIVAGEIIDILSDVYGRVDRKTFAIEEAPKLSSFVRPIVFKNWDNGINVEKIFDDVYNTIRNNLTKTVKYEAIRDAWFAGVVYNV